MNRSNHHHQQQQQHQVTLIAWISLSLSRYPFLLLLVGSLDSILCPHRTDEYKSLLVGQRCCMRVWESIRVCPCFPSSAHRGRIFILFQSSIFFKHLFSVLVVQLYINTGAAISWKNTRIYLSEWSDFYLIDILSIAIHAFPIRILASLPGISIIYIIPNAII